MKESLLEFKEIKPALSGYISKSLVLLTEKQVPDDDAVHDIRVLMKKSRAVLRLIQPQLKSEYYDKDFQSLKQVGKILSGWRDAAVHRKNLKVLKKRYPSIFINLENNEKIKFYLSKGEAVSVPEENIMLTVKQIDELLRKTGYRIRFLNMSNIDNILLFKQLQISYEKTGKVYLDCINKPRPRRMHDFRKRTKDLFYQLSFFRPYYGSKMKSTIKRLDRLAQNLGKYNDLYQLILALDYNYPNDGLTPELDLLVIKIREKQHEYLSSIWTDAFYCFSVSSEISTFLKGMNNNRSDYEDTAVRQSGNAGQVNII